MPDGTWKREGGPATMVPLDAAQSYYPTEKLVFCDADHSQIAKLERGESGIYSSVKWSVKQALYRAVEEQACFGLSRLRLPCNIEPQASNSARDLRDSAHVSQNGGLVGKVSGRSSLQASERPHSQH